LEVMRAVSKLASQNNIFEARLIHLERAVDEE